MLETKDIKLKKQKQTLINFKNRIYKLRFQLDKEEHRLWMFLRNFINKQINLASKQFISENKYEEIKKYYNMSKIDFEKSNILISRLFKN